MNKHEFLASLEVSFLIAVIIFVNAVLSDFSVTMYHGSTDSLSGIALSFVAIFVNMFFVMLLLRIQGIKKLILRMYGARKE